VLICHPRRFPQLDRVCTLQNHPVLRDLQRLHRRGERQQLERGLPADAEREPEVCDTKAAGGLAHLAALDPPHAIDDPVFVGGNNLAPVDDGRVAGPPVAQQR